MVHSCEVGRGVQHFDGAEIAGGVLVVTGEVGPCALSGKVDFAVHDVCVVVVVGVRVYGGELERTLPVEVVDHHFGDGHLHAGCGVVHGFENHLAESVAEVEVNYLAVLFEFLGIEEVHLAGGILRGLEVHEFGSLALIPVESVAGVDVSGEVEVLLGPEVSVGHPV